MTTNDRPVPDPDPTSVAGHSPTEPAPAEAGRPANAPATTPTETAATIPSVTVTGRRDLLATIPYLLGYHPAGGDIVLVGLRQHRMVLAGRSELGWPAGVVADRFTAALDRLTHPGEVPDDVMLVGYCAADAAAAVVQVAQAVSAAGHPVSEVLRVAHGRYVCLRCTGCSPPEGVPIDATATAAAAQATLLGLVALPSRADRVALLDHDPTGAAATRLATESAAADLPAGPAGAAAVDDLLAVAETGRRLNDDQTARLILLLHHRPWRDHAWLRTVGRQWQLELWCDLTRRAVPHLVTPVAALAAWCAWRAGDGTTARAGAARARHAEPTYRLAVLVDDLLDAGIPPTALDWPPDPDELGDTAGPARPRGRMP